MGKTVAYSANTMQPFYAVLNIGLLIRKGRIVGGKNFYYKPEKKLPGSNFRG